MAITALDSVIVAARDLSESADVWTRAGFAVREEGGCATLAAGAVRIELKKGETIGITGWRWGDASSGSRNCQVLEGIATQLVPVSEARETRQSALEYLLGKNQNTVQYLEHIVVMVPELEAAIAAFESASLPCKRIREAGRGMRQAFFKLEETVFEIVGPTPGRPRAWGLAFMSEDLDRAVAVARGNGLQATEPKTAVQGGRIARIVTPLDGVAVAFMDKR